ncbi:AraC family transcriptional regulator [uncultured Clostridium sp.]|uniref:helix-turn-helix domain-containing protein n=1 Tax=uncultured Clostridium sp. TaxID=59620 RepID=UPI0025E36552|nr:AraC family transcriptional regulator [uncultured Clostridium sp.]
MNTEEIIKKCTEFPEVSFKSGPNNILLILNHPHGTGSMNLYQIFPGISIAYISINSDLWPAPDLSKTKNSSIKNPLLLNYCISGRCELLLDNNTFVYLKNGDFSITTQCAQKDYTYPTKYYEGIEFFIDIDLISSTASYINDIFKIDIANFINIYCSSQNIYISKCTENIATLLMEMWNLYNGKNLNDIFTIQILTLRLLKILSVKENMPKQKSCTFFTSTQVKIAQKTQEIITSDLSQHHPAWQLAELFSISETSLKNYFRGVYGENISVYLRKMRMKKASEMLENTRLPISKIAEQVGYMNQSKFASVFKLHFNISPLEYRRQKAIEHIKSV